MITRHDDRRGAHRPYGTYVRRRRGAEAREVRTRRRAGEARDSLRGGRQEGVPGSSGPGAAPGVGVALREERGALLPVPDGRTDPGAGHRGRAAGADDGAGKERGAGGRGGGERDGRGEAAALGEEDLGEEEDEESGGPEQPGEGAAQGLASLTVCTSCSSSYASCVPFIRTVHAYRSSKRTALLEAP